MLSLIRRRRWDGAFLVAATIAQVTGCGGDDTTPTNEDAGLDAARVPDGGTADDARPGTDGGALGSDGATGQDGSVATDGGGMSDGAVGPDGGMADASLDAGAIVADGSVPTDAAATDSGTPDASPDGALSTDGAVAADGGVGPDGAVLPDAEPDAGLLMDTDILHVLVTADNGEIDEAQFAISHATLPTVVTFAQRMVAEHLVHRQSLTDLAAMLSLVPTPNEVSASLATMASQELVSLQSKGTGTEVDATYVGDQVTAHQQVLTLIDERLIPSAQDASLRAIVVSTRAVISEHLAAAEQLFRTLSDGGTLPPNTSDSGVDAGVEDASLNP